LIISFDRGRAAKDILFFHQFTVGPECVTACVVYVAQAATCDAHDPV